MRIRFHFHDKHIDHDHPTVPHIGEVVHLVHDTEYAHAVLFLRHFVGRSDGSPSIEVWLRDATSNDLPK